MPVNERVITQFGKQWTQPGKMVSNGPYKLASWVVNERIEAERNPSTGMTPIPGSAGDLPAARFPAWGAAALKRGGSQLTNRWRWSTTRRPCRRHRSPDLRGLPLLGTIFIPSISISLNCGMCGCAKRSPWPLIATCREKVSGQENVLPGRACCPCQVRTN